MGLRLMTCVVLCATVILTANSAPTSLTSSTDDAHAASATAAEKPLVRTKRAEEILYGNHQNAPRVKKSDPASAAAATDDDDDSSRKTANKENTVATSAAGTDGKANQLETEDGDRPAAPVDDQDDDAAAAAQSETHSVEDIPMEMDDADYQRYDGNQEGSEEGTATDALRKKRSIKNLMMTAENMIDSRAPAAAAVAISRPVRAKRDLDYEDLRRILAASRDSESPYQEEEEEEEEREAEEVPERVHEMAPESDEGEEEVEDEEEGPIAVALPYEYGPRYDGPSEKEELIRELVEKKVEEDAKKQLLDYLLAAALASERESNEGDDKAAEEEEEDLDEGPPGRLVYDDEPRDFVPAPVLLKRSEFYPYSYEPYGGRWGAMVPGTKRSSNEYERLYRLAEALNADEDYEEK